MQEEREAWLDLLVSPCLRRNGERFPVPDSAAGYLICFLAARADWVRREELATLMWPDAPEAAAQHNLRVNLNRLRPLLRERGVEHALVAEQRRLRLDLPCDAVALREAHAGGQWLAAADMPHVGFLQSLSFRAFPVLGEWARQERERLRELWRDALLRAAPSLPSTSVLSLVTRYRSVDPLDEEVLRLQLGALVALDQRTQAAAIYKRFASDLRDELGAAPGEPLRDFVDRLLGRALGVPPEADLGPTKPAGAPIPRAVLQPPGLVGRDAELRALQDAAQRVVLLVGEPGAGKSRLLEEALPRGSWLRCVESAAQSPLAPLAAWLDDHRDALPALEGDLRELRRLLSPDTGAELLPVASAADVMPRVLSAAAEVLEIVGQPVVIDDFQWADGATAQLALHLARRHKLRIVLSLRPHPPSPLVDDLVAALRTEIGDISTIHLGPFDVWHLATLLTSMAPASTAAIDAVAAWLFRRSGGNPFFSLELLRAQFESGRVDAKDHRWLDNLAGKLAGTTALEVPPRQLELIRRRLQRLSEVTQRAVAVAAIAGGCHHIDALASAAGLAPWVMAQAMAEAEEAGLVTEQRFSHDLVREAIRGSLPPAMARWMNARVAECLAPLLPAEAIAAHWWAADEPARAVDATIEAFERARARGLQAQALPLIENALGRVSDSALRGRLLAAAAQLQQELADASSAHRDANAALAEAVAPADRARALVVLAQLAYQAGSAAKAREWLDEATLSNPRDAGLLRLRTQLAILSGDSSGLLEALKAEVAGLRQSPPSSALISALTTLGAVFDENGSPERGLPLHEEALSLARKLNARSLQVDVTINLVWCLTALPGRAADAFAVAEEALALGEYDGSDTLRNNLAWAYADAGRLQEALAIYRRLSAGRDPSLACVACSKIVELQARLGAPLGELQAAVDQTLESMARTDFSVAHASAIAGVLDHGTAEQVERALKWLRRDWKLDRWLQERLDAALAARGFDAAN